MTREPKGFGKKLHQGRQAIEKVDVSTDEVREPSILVKFVVDTVMICIGVIGLVRVFLDKAFERKERHQ